MSVETDVAGHYTEGILEQRIITALRQAGKNPDRPDPDDLAPVDESSLQRECWTSRLGMDGQVSFEHGTALNMASAGASFDVATLLHVGMNIADKDRLFSEVRRVVKPGGIFGIYDQMREAGGELAFPVPWASVPQTSFVETAPTYKRLLTEAGFEIVWERNALAPSSNRRARSPARVHCRL